MRKIPLFSFPRNFIPKQIWQQIFFILVFVVVIPLGSLGVLLVTTSQKAIKETVLRDQRELAVHTTREIKEHVYGASELLYVTAALLGTLDADRWKQQTALVELALRNPAFERASFVSMDGYEMTTSELGTSLRFVNKEPAFEKASRGESYISPVKISSDYLPFVTMSVPVRHLGSIQGVLLADFSLRSIWDMVDLIKVRITGKAFIFDQTGRMIAHPDKKVVFENKVLDNPKILQEVTLARAGNVIDTDRNGQRWLMSYAPIESLHWGLVLMQSEKEALSSSQTMKTQSWLFVVLAVLLTLGISFLLSRYMSRPIKSLIDGLRRISAGDYSQMLPIRGRNEIDRLMFSFNKTALRLRKAQEMERLSIIGKATAAVVHELKNSLQLVETFVRLLPERAKDQRFIKEFSDTIPKELDSWNSSLRNIMTFAKQRQIAMQATDINEVIKDVVLLSRLKARQLGIHFETHLKQDVPLMVISSEGIKQVLLNLTTNAFEATESGGAVSVSTRLLTAPDIKSRPFLEIEVVDNGKPIDPQDVSKVFEPFFSTKTGSLGLGLSISKEIVEKHSGTIEFQAREGKKFFIVRMPVTLTKVAEKWEKETSV